MLDTNWRTGGLLAKICRKRVTPDTETIFHVLFYDRAILSRTTLQCGV